MAGLIKKFRKKTRQNVGVGTKKNVKCNDNKIRKGPSKDWPIKKLTKVYPRFLIEKLSELFLFFYLHFL
jgi:hypothetical protein